MNDTPTGLYTGSSEDSFKSMEEINNPSNNTNPSTETQPSSQTDIDLTKYEEKLVPPTEEVINNGINNSPSFVVANEKPEEKTTQDTQKELDSNEKANEGIMNTKPMSENWNQYMKDEKASIDKIKAHQEALDSNEKANEGTMNTKPMSENWNQYMKDEKASIDKIKTHQEALDRNTKANEGFTNMTTMSQGWKEYMEKEKESVKQEEDKISLTDVEKSLSEKLAQIEKDIKDLRGGRSITELSETDRALLAELIRQQNILLEGQQKENKKQEGEKIHTPEEENKEDSINKIENNKRERDYKKAKIIGMAIGGTIGALGGAEAAAIGLLAAGVTGLGLWITDRVAQKQIDNLRNKLADVKLGSEEKAKLEKTLERWNKYVKISDTAKAFLKGAGIGLAVSGMFSKIFMGGKGLLTGLGPKAEIGGAIGRAPVGSGQTPANVPGAETAPIPTATGGEYMYTVQSGDSMPRLVQEAARMAGKDPLVAERLLYQQPNLDATFRGMLGVNNPLGNTFGGAQGGAGTGLNLEPIVNFLQTNIP